MKNRYIVRVEHEVIEYTELEIYADSEEQALELARTEPSRLNEVEWTLDDYIGDNSFEVIAV